MTTTTALLVNALLALGIIGALAATVRIAFRLRTASRPETLHPSQPIPLRIADDWQQDRVRAAA